MNKEQQQIIDEVYENYKKEMLYHPEENWLDNEVGGKSYRQLSQQEFINKCKTDNEFSENWGLKIEERELSLEERVILAGYYENRGGIGWNMLKETVDMDNSIPRKLITITYNNETIESYE